jgi:RNA polymerase sigma factor (sigma-70 family)
MAMKASDPMLGDLMRRAQDGDATAYRAVLDASQSWLKRYYANRIAPSEIDDLVQDTLISVHRKRATYDPERPYLPWLAAIARFRWVDRLRKTYRNATDEIPEDIGIDSHEETVGAYLGVERLLGKLPEAQALVIRLVKIDGLAVTEAAERTGQSESLVKVNIHRGLKKLAAMIESG